jgi:hypothetical protein
VIIMATATRTEFYTAEEYAAAKETDIAAFLISVGYGLTRSGHCWKGKVHDSLSIRDDGRWYWNSRDLHGYSPIELYKQILLNDCGYTDEITAAIAAVKELAGTRGAYAAPLARREPAPPPRPPDEPLILPAPHADNRRVMAYLCAARGLDPDIVRGLMKYGRIYETVQRWDKETRRFVDGPHRNAVFVAYDRDGRPQSAFLRGTIPNAEKPFKKDVDGSDKSHPFILCGRESANRVFVFEGAIDAISHASLQKTHGGDWRNDRRISLGGTGFLGLERFLSGHPNVTTIVSCLDNDATGERRSVKLADEYAAKGYAVKREAPMHKDFNEDLIRFQQEKEDDLDFER